VPVPLSETAARWRAGKPAGVNAFPRDLAERYLAAGARFILAGADVTLLAVGSEELAARHLRPRD
jgi:4-hydroxy-2-oxoheptanedioate aldolase